MAEVKFTGGAAPSYKPYVAPESSMAEFTLRALVIGLVMSVVLGAANAYLGLKAGMTIAATYPAAVIGMALLRIVKGSILEENFARTVGSIGESVAAGAIFTIPAFYIARIWYPNFATTGHYLESTAIMAAGGVLGIMFVALLRRVMVEDKELPFPESVAAAEIHKAGRSTGTGAKFLFGAMGVGALIQALGQFKFFATTWEKLVTFAPTKIGLRSSGEVTAQGGMLLSSPGISPAYIGVGYIIGPKLASLNFSGGLLAWGLFVPILMYFIGPTLLAAGAMPDEGTWTAMAGNIWRLIVRPIAIGGMLVSAGYTLFRMRKSLATGLARSISDVKKAAAGGHVTVRTEQDLKFNWVMIGILAAGVATFFIYNYFAQSVSAALVATLVMIIAGFFFAAVSGYLVGIIGSSNNPISGLTLSTLLVAALLMVVLGMKGTEGVAAVLGVAAVVCVAAAVAGEMLQDLKVGHILGGTPWKMQVGDLFGIALAAAVMFLPLVILHEGDIKAGQMASPPYEGGFGSPKLSAPQASLMALLSQGIVGGTMPWPLIIVGMFMGFGFILMQVRSPMLVSVGMYLPLETTFAIFVGGLIKGIVEKVNAKKQFNEAQKARVENTGVLLASGLIAGEALIGLLFAGLAFAEVQLFAIFEKPSFLISLVVLALIGWILVQIPVKNAGRADEPAPPSGVF
ncbi:MAG: oligopeptide transporter, OPT family [candidate division KSB1 bacterium]|nr:oligopeptide transporter, OPT family [candidate division KSB1 bacterium]MDZ7274947.1 oligopeptide transporter, OPT family [candidate division KSB1 bacterium]MDZ7286602.1 oligopeptide transporter, OPT family [candidate division KSB1 bacterium]MDZ7299234.1 oligopeptide transporter, OPT family [candidate division KSB1 bacterium]MDZ7309183.1 oligopeptide transporter, OPT family [candidate division KSB1 bacterium]